MATRLPSDLTGGFEFTKPFEPTPLKKGQIWRKCGPIGAIKVLSVLLPGSPDHDGASPGIMMQVSELTRARVRWGKKFFMLGDERQIHEQLRETGRALC